MLWFSHTTFASLAQDVPPAAPPPSPATNLTVLPGFKAVEVRAAQPGEGSWVCLAIDDKGRLIISPEELVGQNATGKPATGGLLRLTLSSEGRVTKVETINLPVGAAMGLLYAFNSLYVNGQGPDGTGLYRLRDTDGDDQFDQVEFLKRFEGTFRPAATGEHGPHGIVLGPDQMLYVINGNETKPPAGCSPGSPHKNYQEDQLLPPQLWPANYTWANGPPPGGCVLRTDPEGKEWTLVCGGLRNAYDLAFNRDGEMFTFDSDMDWDDGSPWYRPTRINHLVSGGEYGWRKGTGKWPEHYPDSLRGTLDIGRSSPTGLKFGYDAQFPRRYRQALYACDWAFGAIYAVHFTPSGASYKATAEKFITGKPLNVTDMEFGRDGAMYFITGGRGTQSALYRVSYEEPIAKQAPVWGQVEQVGLKSRQLRHKLESYHGRQDPSAIDFAWPHLDSGDRWIRYAARIAIEWQDVKLWQRRALDEPRPVASINALLALARCGDRSTQRQLLESLARLNAGELSEEHKLDALRVLELALIRMGRPDRGTASGIIERLDALYPAASDLLNRELCQLLVYLEAPGVIPKTLALLAQAKAQEQRMAYAFALRNVKRGWTLDQRTAYFQWFPKAAAHYTGSSYFLGFLADTKRDAVATLTPDERKALAACLEEKGKAVAATPAIPPRAFVKDWKWEDLLPVLDQVSHGRSSPKGREAFTAAQCVQCHRFGDEGGAIGPDLTAVGSRFNRHDLLEAILLPSKVVPDQFQNTMIATKDGDAHTGRVMFEDADKLVLSPNPLTPDRVEIPKRSIQSRQVSKLSPMPEGLVNVLTKEEILDLLAFLESGGKLEHSSFGK